MRTSEKLDSNLITVLSQSSSRLIFHIQEAVKHFYMNPPRGWETWEVWRTPKPWQERVLENLESYSQELETAIEQFKKGAIKPVTLTAASYASLSKDIDMDMNWMTEQDRLAVKEDIGHTVRIADKIYRMGYDLLADADKG